MKHFKKSFLTIFLLSSLASSAYAAQELSSEKAASLQSFKEISTRGQFFNRTESANAISKLADKEGAAYFYITSVNIKPGNESLRVVYAKLYKADAIEKQQEPETYRQFSGVYEYPKQTAIKYEPYDIVKLRGYFPTQYEMNTAVAKSAATKEAYAYYIDRIFEGNGGNLQITAYLFKKDAAERKIQPDDAIPYDSEAGQQALAQGGEAAMQVEKPGYYSSSAFNEQFYSKKFNNTTVEEVNAQSNSDVKKSNENTEKTEENAETNKSSTSIIPQSKSSRYTVTLPDGTQIQELNDATAAKMVPFDTIKFKGYFVTAQEVSYNAGKKAAEKGAKYYHISRISQDTRGSNRTIYVDLYR